MKIEANLDLAHEVALLIRFVVERELWDEYESFKAIERPWATKQIEEFFRNDS